MVGGVVLIDYYNCADCNYQFLTEYDSRCPKCGNGNPKYTDIKKNNQELLNLIYVMDIWGLKKFSFT